MDEKTRRNAPGELWYVLYVLEIIKKIIITDVKMP